MEMNESPYVCITDLYTRPFLLSVGQVLSQLAVFLFNRQLHLYHTILLCSPLHYHLH